MTMELFIAGLEADGWWIVRVYERSVLAEMRSARYRLFPEFPDHDFLECCKA